MRHLSHSDVINKTCYDNIIGIQFSLERYLSYLEYKLAKVHSTVLNVYLCILYIYIYIYIDR